MRFGVLGALEVRLGDGRAVAVGGPRLRALLALLLLDAGRVVTVERLVGGLYGDGRAPGDSVGALQAQVSRLRALLGDRGDGGELVVRRPAGYLIAVDPEAVDACRFERLAAEGRRALSAGDPERASALLEEALGLWRGPALADVGDAPFAAAQAVRLEEARLAAAEDRAEAELATGRHREAVTVLQELVAAHPLRERPAGQLMRALYACGRQADALAVFEGIRRRLAEELGADPSAGLTATHLAILRAEPSLAPAGTAGTADTADPPPDLPRGLPAHLTPLIGRADELERIRVLLGGGRLVTLTGPGGTGKTRLATEAAGRLDGEVCFVELGPLGDGAEVPQAVLGALGLRETGLLSAPNRQQPAPDPTGRLVAALTGRSVLLVLDNCEHVVDDAARLADRLLSACPGVRVLATSREALGITGEVLCPVPPLELPGPGDPPERAASVRLFAERASAVRPDFTLGSGPESGADDATARAVVQICRSLDGLPLAIELAAARLRSLTAVEIAARLDDRFRLLSRGSRTAQPRHRTLHAVVGWSWDLLDEDERTMARRLTVFAGGATLEAAERVCGVADADGVLASLVDKSFVEVVGGRYRMLETIRAFCAERLAEAGEEERLRRAHLDHFLGLAETADPHLRRDGQLEWLERLDHEHDNLHAALHRAARAGDLGPALRLLAALTCYWWLRSLRSEASALARDLLDGLDAGPPAGLADEYALCVMTAVSGGGGDRRLDAHLEAVRKIMNERDSMPRQPFANVLWAMVAGPPEPDVAREMMRRWERIEVNDPWLSAIGHFGWAYFRLFDGDLEEAGQEFALALADFRSVGDRWGMAQAISGLADIAGRRGERAKASSLTDQALALAERLGAAIDVAELLHRRADGRLRDGDTAGARADYERAAELGRRAGAWEVLAAAHLGLGEIARFRGDLEEARRSCEAALAECSAGWFDVEETRARVCVALGWVAEAEGDAAGALAWYRRAFTTGRGVRDLTLAARVAEGLAGVALLERDGERAALLLGAGAALRGLPSANDPDAARVAGRCRALIGGAAYEAARARGVEAVRGGRSVLGAVPRPAPLTVIGEHLSALGR
ncbi:SARP family transcriptional regulator [Planomonospora parontospora subsp. parontospora]|uniref:SARP family transcriptional regulator n=2 Tax=Planomonospora parontospora TaxID=58119 RepID=A0AA37BFN8_9ACTN|nr:BTAD domain-containing putative transcriptional regulator [Planomonospora parontospora]GGK64665.1 SARP family transcriptional regulator [Planomonospora parontospora]GII08061.1 SARP family transcriptional regulator [Planomonospora parontospora subsp. parontospora]